MVGVALGVATLIVVLSVMGGFREQLIGRIIGMNGHIVVTAREGMLQTTPELLETLRTAPGVSEKRGTTHCMRTSPSSGSGTVTMVSRAMKCGSAKISAAS